MKTKRTAGSSAAAGSGCPRKAACGQNSPPHGRLSTAPTWCREHKTKINSVPNWGDLWYACPTRAPKQKACKAGTRKRDDQEIRLRAALAKFPWNALGRGRFHGTWKLNVGKSTFAKGRELKELTVTIAEQGENQVFTIKGTLGNGNPLSFKYTAPIKGGPISYIEGAADGTATVSKRVDARTLDSTATLDGKQIEATHCVLSAKGKIATMTRNAVDPDGKTLKSVEVYDRQ
jgi:hypothetical protein